MEIRTSELIEQLENKTKCISQCYAELRGRWVRERNGYEKEKLEQEKKIDEYQHTIAKLQTENGDQNLLRVNYESVQTTNAQLTSDLQKLTQKLKQAEAKLEPFMRAAEAAVKVQDVAQAEED